MSDPDYEYEDICLCDHSTYDHAPADPFDRRPQEGTTQDTMGEGPCDLCGCSGWRP